MKFDFSRMKGASHRMEVQMGNESWILVDHSEIKVQIRKWNLWIRKRKFKFAKHRTNLDEWNLNWKTYNHMFITFWHHY